MTEPRELLLLSRAAKALAEATSVDEVKDLCDKAAAVQAYARKARFGQQIVTEAAAIRLRAERRLGQMLQSIDLADSAPGNQYTAQVQHDAGDDHRLYLRDLGLTKSDSARSQRLAKLPEEVFERYLADNLEAHREPTLSGLLRFANTHQPAGAGSSFCEPPTLDAAPFTEVVGNQRFTTVYADPPWPQTTPALPMSPAQIAALPIAGLSRENAHLHIWATNASLPDALAVIRAWGFAYRSCLAVQRHLGVPYEP